MAGMKITKNRFGLLSDGTKVHLYTVSNGKMSVSMTDYGCTLTSILLPARKGRMVDVVLGFSTLDGVVRDTCSFGSIVGRFANRIGGASFVLNGVKYELDKNDNGVNTLHGGFDRWEKKVWKAKRIKTEHGAGIQFSRRSPDGEQGFPGAMKVTVTYTLSDDNVLTLAYNAVADRPTPVNLTNHAYFNLKGHNGGSVADQKIKLNCSRYLAVDDKLIPTGVLNDVAGTPYDFTHSRLIGEDLGKVGVGYDHCYCVDGYVPDGSLRDIAEVEDPASGRKMLVRSTLPGVQFYTGNYIEGISGKDGIVYHKHGALCLETEDFPDAPNKASFPPVILSPDKPYHQITQYAFKF